MFDLFRSFLPLRNPLGFGASDFIELALAVILVGLILLRGAIEPWVRKLAARTGWAMLTFAALTCASRLLLLPHCPVPTPSGSDDFGYILLGDTLRHFRLANPPHPLSQFFESIFILQQPTYSSIYPLGPGMVLALGFLVFGSFWAGVLLAEAAFCAFCYWMLRAWTTPQWAFAGGLLAIAELGPLSSWMNSYWGGALSGIAGCLVFGSIPRLRRSGRTRDAVLLGLGLAIQLLTRPFEFVLLVAAVALICLPDLLRGRLLFKSLYISGLCLVPALGLVLLHNKAVTSSWTTLPYMLSRYEYGIPTTFTFQPNPVPHRALTPEQNLDYRAQCAIHGMGTDTPADYMRRLWGRVRYLRFFWFAPLYFAAAAFLFTFHTTRLFSVVLAILIVALGTNFYPFFYPHYVAAVACLLLLVCIKGLEKLNRQAAKWIFVLCGVQFLFWYGIYLDGNPQLLPVIDFQTWSFINYGDPEGRIAIARELDRSPGKQLVFVRYWPGHLFHEWIHNAAEIDSSRVVWARDLGDAENQKLIRYYPDRHAWLVEPDARPPRLIVYRSEGASFVTVH